MNKKIINISSSSSKAKKRLKKYLKIKQQKIEGVEKSVMFIFLVVDVAVFVVFPVGDFLFE